jgi:hypothetical protein
MKRRNIFPRLGALMLALTILSGTAMLDSISSAWARYRKADTGAANEFAVMRFYSWSSTAVGSFKGWTGEWAFYVRGEDGGPGGPTGSRKGGTGGTGAALKGVIKITAATVTFHVGMTGRRNVTNQTNAATSTSGGGYGGSATYMLLNSTNTPMTAGLITSNGSDVLAMAGGGGGGGGAGQNYVGWNGGNAGGADTSGAVPVVNGVNGAHRGWSSGSTPVPGPNRPNVNAENGGGGGLDDAGGSGWGGQAGSLSPGDGGAWFGLGGNQASGSWGGGGGAGLWGGGGGGKAASGYSDGGGGGGSSYIRTTNVSAVPEVSGTPTSYREAAIQHFNQLAADMGTAPGAVLVWLGP